MYFILPQGTVVMDLDIVQLHSTLMLVELKVK